MTMIFRKYNLSVGTATHMVLIIVLDDRFLSVSVSSKSVDNLWDTPLNCTIVIFRITEHKTGLHSLSQIYYFLSYYENIQFLVLWLFCLRVYVFLLTSMKQQIFLTGITNFCCITWPLIKCRFYLIMHGLLTLHMILSCMLLMVITELYTCVEYISSVYTFTG